MSALPRVQKVVLPILRGHNDLADPISVVPALAGVKVGSWVEDVDFREFPMINVRRLGGPRVRSHPKKFGLPVIELTAYGDEGLVETEQLFEDALEVLYDAVKYQRGTPYGYLQSITETMGGTQFSSLYMDSWRIQGLIQLGLRAPRT